MLFPIRIPTRDTGASPEPRRALQGLRAPISVIFNEPQRGAVPGAGTRSGAGEGRGAGR